MTPHDRSTVESLLSGIFDLAHRVEWRQLRDMVFVTDVVVWDVAFSTRLWLRRLVKSMCVSALGTSHRKFVPPDAPAFDAAVT